MKTSCEKKCHQGVGMGISSSVCRRVKWSCREERGEGEGKRGRVILYERPLMFSCLPPALGELSLVFRQSSFPYPNKRILTSDWNCENCPAMLFFITRHFSLNITPRASS